MRIRDYMLASQMQGDPGFFKRLRKLKVGRFLGKVARVGVGFVPGVGGLLSQVAQRFHVSPQVLHDYAASQGIDVSDMGDPGPKPKKVSKRERAAAGPKAKAQARSQAKGRKPKGGGGNLGKSLGAGAAAVAGSLPAALEALKSGNPLSMLSLPGAPTTAQLKAHMGIGGGHRRHMNPANTHALRRSLRRVEGFERLVASVRKSERKLLGAISRHSGGHRGGSSRMKGHKAGCGCVACRRAA